MSDKAKNGAVAPPVQVPVVLVLVLSLSLAFNIAGAGLLWSGKLGWLPSEGELHLRRIQLEQQMACPANLGVQQQLQQQQPAVQVPAVTTTQVQQAGADAGAVPTDPAPAPAPVPAVVSGLGPALSDAELHGGWQLTQEIYDRATRHPNVTVVNWEKPRVMLVHNFLSQEEVQHLIGLAEGSFSRSTVVAETAQTDARTSFGAWLDGYKRDDVVRAVQHRIHDLLGIPEEFGESLYVLRYQNMQKYDPHHDNCAHQRGVWGTESCKEFLARAGGPECGPGKGGVTCGDRLTTFILYLESPVKGGATVFPKSRIGQAKEGAVDVEGVDEYCQDSSNALQVQPPPGSAAIFWDYVPSPDGNTAVAVNDDFSQHGGCPVVEGTKLIATRWIRSAEFI